MESGRTRVAALVVVVLFVSAAPVLLAGQWANYPTPGIPRLPDGKPDLSAPTPRAANGRPDLSGIWLRVGGVVVGEEVAFQPWAEAEFKRRRENFGKDNPGSRCLPQGPGINVAGIPSKLVQTPGLIIMLYDEPGGFYRQIFTDGRELPKDPNPSWVGYSVGHWEGDTLVVHTNGYNDRGWINGAGPHPRTEALHVVERYRRPDFGHLELEMTVDDPKAYTRPWVMTVKKQLLADTEIIEYVCAENERSVELMGK